MADLKFDEKGNVVETVEAKVIPLTVEQHIDFLRKDVAELSRGVNTQAAVLSAIIVAFDHVLKEYTKVTQPHETKIKESK